MYSTELDDLIEAVIDYFECTGCPTCCDRNPEDDSECIYKLAVRLQTERKTTNETTDEKAD